MVDHDDKPLPSPVVEAQRFLSRTLGEFTQTVVDQCTVPGEDCGAYVSSPGGNGERTRYRCSKEECGRP